jgi:hypothetical protein
MIARSRRRAGELPSQAVIRRWVRGSGIKYLGISARRQEARPGTASSRSAWQWSWTLRARTGIITPEEVYL